MRNYALTSQRLLSCGYDVNGCTNTISNGNIYYGMLSIVLFELDMSVPNYLAVAGMVQQQLHGM